MAVERVLLWAPAVLTHWIARATSPSMNCYSSVQTVLLARLASSIASSSPEKNLVFSSAQFIETTGSILDQESPDSTRRPTATPEPGQAATH
jgi:hypothetical protein